MAYSGTPPSPLTPPDSVRILKVILPEFFSRWPFRVDIERYPVRILNGKPSVAPWMVLQRYNGREPRSCKPHVFLVDIIDKKVVYESVAAAQLMFRLQRRHELQGGGRITEFEVHIPSAIEGYFRTEISDIKIPDLPHPVRGECGR